MKTTYKNGLDSSAWKVFKDWILFVFVTISILAVAFVAMWYIFSNVLQALKMR